MMGLKVENNCSDATEERKLRWWSGRSALGCVAWEELSDEKYRNREGSQVPKPVVKVRNGRKMECAGSAICLRD